MADDTPAVRDGLRRTTLEFARTLALAVAGVYCVFLIFNLVDLSGSTRFWVCLHDTGIIASATAIWILLRRGAIPTALVHPFMAFMGVVIGSNVLLAMSFTEEPFYTVYIIVLVMALGFFLLSTRWFLTATVALLAAWVPPAAISVPPRQLISFAFALGVATTIAIVLQRIQRRTRIGLEELRIRDESRQRELRTALDAVQRELVEREIAERDRERLEAQLRQSQKLEAIGTLAGGIAHDFNNMLAVIIGTASSMREEELTAEEVQTDAGEILDAARRAAELTRNLLGFARQGETEAENVDLANALTEVMRLLQRTIPKKIAVHTTINARDAVFRGDAQQIGQALMNLCINGVQAMGEDGTLTLALDVVDLDEASCPPGLAPRRYARVRVVDTGVGMSASVVERAFDPFFTTKPRGEGTGLGLAMVYGTVTRHGGTVLIDSQPKQGTTITVLLPTIDEPATGAVAEEEPWPRGTGTVLVVDDEEFVRDTVRRILERLGYTVILAHDGVSGIETFRAHDGIDLVVLDVAMPVMDGTECFAQMRAHDPDVRILITSGFAQDGAVERLLEGGAVGFVPKPFDGRQLARAVARSMAS